MKKIMVPLALGAALVLVLSAIQPEPGRATETNRAGKTGRTGKTGQLSEEDAQQLRELYLEARSHVTEEAYEKSNATFQKLLELLPQAEDGALDPNRKRIFYDMACNFALLGKKEDAISYLRQAIESGFWDYDYLSRDTSLQSLRSEEKFQSLLASARTKLASIAFGLKDIDGNEIKKEDYEGKVVILDFWGTWCPPCRMEIPHFVRLQKKYGKHGLRIIGMTWERKPADDAIKRRVKNFADQNDVNYPLVLVTPELLDAVPDLRGFPTTLYVDRNLAVVDRISGYHPYDALEKRAVKLLEKSADLD